MKPVGTDSLKFLVYATAVTAMGGFLFGYDTAVINGANLLLQEHFGLQPDRDTLWIGLATSAAILGCVPGAMSAGFISDRFGRRSVLFYCGILFATAGILSAIPRNFGEFIAARLLSGVAIGVSSMICPVYIAEVAPPRWRGRLGSLFQLGIVTGILLSLFVNALIQQTGDAAWNSAYGWRWMLGVEAVPALLFFGLLFLVPESPRWLILAGRETEARAILKRRGDSEYARREVAAVKLVLGEAEGSFAELFSPANRRPLLIAIVLMAGSQFSGINAIMYYSTEIFQRATGNATAAFAASAWIGLINLLATFIAILFVDLAGRRPLLLIGNAVQVIALAAVGLIFAHNPHSSALLGFVILYIAGFAMAMGPLPWIICSEIFPARLRGRAMSLATFCIWGACLVVAQTFPWLLKAIGSPATFWIFAGCSLATLGFVALRLPETKGRSLEEIETEWRRSACLGVGDKWSQT